MFISKTYWHFTQVSSEHFYSLFQPCFFISTCTSCTIIQISTSTFKQLVVWNRFLSNCWIKLVPVCWINRLSSQDTQVLKVLQGCVHSHVTILGSKCIWFVL